MLMDLGYENAQAIRGGLQGWQEAGYPMAGTQFEGTG
jgi:rhodanese-related sulfurtransferase